MINPALLSHLSPVHSTAAGVLSIPREENPAKAVVLFKPAPWGTGVPPVGESTVENQDTSSESQDTGSEIQDMDLNATPMEASPLMQDEDAMDVDS